MAGRGNEQQRNRKAAPRYEQISKGTASKGHVLQRKRMAGLRNSFAMIGKAKEKQCNKWHRKGNERRYADLQRKRQAKERRGDDATRIETNSKGMAWIGKAKEAHRSVQTRYAKAQYNIIFNFRKDLKE